MEQILTISIPTYSKRTKIKPHIVYHISITAPVRSWTVQRRYSDFYELNQKFIEAKLNPPIPLPPKSSIFSLTSFDNVQFVETRRKGLEEYLQAILSEKDDSFKKIVEWKAFLGIPQLKSRNMFENDENSTNFSSSSSSLNSIKKEHGDGGDLLPNKSAFSKSDLKASEKWLEDCRDLNLIINEIRTCIAAKNKFVSRNETAAACEATILARKNHNLLSQKYQVLEMELNRQIDEYYSQQQQHQQDALFNSINSQTNTTNQQRKRNSNSASGILLSKGELSRRQDLLGNIRTVKEQLEKVIGNMKNSTNDTKSMNGSSMASSNNSSLVTNQSVYYSTKGNSNKLNGSYDGIGNQDSISRNSKSKRKFGVNISKEVEEKTRGMDNVQILQLQKDMLDDQDLALEQFTNILKRQKEVGKAINQELDLQNQLLENLDNDVGKVNVGLKQAEKRMKKVINTPNK